GDPVYAYKPSLMGAGWELRLRPDALEWRVGRHEARVPYGRIARVRLSYRPVTMQRRRYVAELWPADGGKLTIPSTTWRGIMEETPQDKAYGDFTRELPRRLAAAGNAASLESGLPPMLYWPGLVVFAGAALALAALTVRGLQTGELAGAAFVGGFFALFLLPSGNYFPRDRPRPYRPGCVPPGRGAGR